MPFTADDLRELLLRLQGDAGACRELRDLMRDPVLERLQSEVAELAAAQRRTEERVDRLAERVAELATAQLRTEERLAVLTERVDRLAERVAELATAQLRTEERLAVLTERVDRLADRLGDLTGESLERRYRERAAAYFGRVLRRSRVLDPVALEEALEERVSPDEMHESLLADVVVSGKPRAQPDVEEVWLAVEVSSVVDREDVCRAVRRSRLLTRSGRPVVPVVAGRAITTGAAEAARNQRVAVFEDGRIANWDEALEEALGSA